MSWRPGGLSSGLLSSNLSAGLGVFLFPSPPDTYRGFSRMKREAKGVGGISLSRWGQRNRFISYSRNPRCLDNTPNRPGHFLSAELPSERSGQPMLSRSSLPGPRSVPFFLGPGRNPLP